MLTIPLLPYRLPIPSLTEFSARLPLGSFELLAGDVPGVVDAEERSMGAMEKRVNLIANLIAFTPPRYELLSAAALDTYLQLLTGLLNALPVNALEPRKSSQSQSHPTSSTWAADDSDSEAEAHSATRITLVNTFAPAPAPSPRPTLDLRTSKRLAALPDIGHLNALLRASTRHPSIELSLVSFFLSLGTVWPGRKERVLSALVVYTGGGLVRSLYRGFVRGSMLGRDDSPAALMGAGFFVLRLCVCADAVFFLVV
jgi:ubiquitin-protein ligase E3 C